MCRSQVRRKDVEERLFPRCVEQLRDACSHSWYRSTPGRGIGRKGKKVFSSKHLSHRSWRYPLESLSLLTDKGYPKNSVNEWKINTIDLLLLKQFVSYFYNLFALVLPDLFAPCYFPHPLKVPLCYAEKLAGGATVRLETVEGSVPRSHLLYPDLPHCHLNCPESRVQPENWLDNNSISLHSKFVPSACIQCFNWAFKAAQGFLQAIVQVRSSMFTPPHQFPPLKSHWTHQPLYFPPTCSAMLHIQAALPTTLHTKSWDPQSILPILKSIFKVITWPNTSSQDLKITTMIFILYNY